MSFQNPNNTEIQELLRQVKTIAVVGLSPKPNRPSHQVSEAMQGYGYRIIPVRPATEMVLGEKCYGSLFDIPKSIQIDLVDVFRASKHVEKIVDACIALNLPAIWLQDGVINEAAAEKAHAAGITVVMNRCVYRDYHTLRVASS